MRYLGGRIIGEGGIVYESGAGTVRAERVEIDTVSGQLTAFGTVSVERLTETDRREITPKGLPKRSRRETVLETLRGENFVYNARTQQGSLDKAELRLSGFALSTDSLVINGRRYVARNVVIRPGALSTEEEKIYGRAPFSLRAKTVTVDIGGRSSETVAINSNAATPGSAASGGNSQDRGPARIVASGAALFYKNTKLLPVPSYILRQATAGSGTREDAPYRLTPRLSLNSTDKFLLTTTLRLPLSKDPLGPAVMADLGLSARIGVRGGATLTYPTRFGSFLLRGRKNDIITTQLTNRIVLDRTPEVIFSTPGATLFNLPGGQKARFGLNFGTGRFSERTIGGSGGQVESNRSTVDAILTTRSEERDGPYVELFALASRYSKFRNNNYRTTGFEVGYYGNITNRVRGLFSYRATDVKGSTPFRFDRVEIARELRTTFDISLTPRYIVPIDLRYDLDLGKLRDERFGLLRNYKTFAYGVTYQTARRELKLEFRQGF
ncbi:MAG TPA: hypothetical protein VF681_06410 [Abditibacteriaceae bacterium]